MMTTGTRITVRRPNGDIEVVMQRGKYYSATEQRKAIEATRAAGRGEILSFEVVEADEPVATEQERLRRERRDLAATVRGAVEDSDAAFEDAHAREDVRAWDIKRRYDGIVKAARAALEDFDDRHPEIIEAIRAEQRERTERFLATD
jgi:hypothetical protein